MPFDTVMVHDVHEIVVSETEALPSGTYYRKITITARDEKMEIVLFSDDTTELSLKEAS